MKPGIHPEYVESTVTCACGNTFQTHSTKASIRLEICSNCHPFFTGKQKFVDTAGRVERFQKRFAKTGGETVKAKKKQTMAKGQKSTILKKKMKILSSAPLVKAKPGSKDAPKAEAKAASPKAH
jgi:large subunit ribosomal protein L31